MAFTSKFKLFIGTIIIYLLREGNGAMLEILPGLTVPPGSATLTARCSASTVSGITLLFNIDLFKDNVKMVSLTVNGAPTLEAGFTGPKYTASGELTSTDPSVSHFLQVDIADPDCNDGVEYKCILTAQDAGGPISPSPQDVQTVFVETATSDLSLTMTPEGLLFFENDVVSFTCSGKVGNPAQAWSWERKASGSPVWESYPNPGDITTGTLNPPSPPAECSFSQQSTLTMTLQATDNDIQIRGLLGGQEIAGGMRLIYVNFGPKVVTLSPPVIDPVIEGEDMTPVTCTSDTCAPYCELEWYRGTPVFTNIINTANGVLELTDVDRSQAGEYICHVYNPSIPDSDITKSLQLDVMYGPDYIHINSSNVVSVIEGDDLPPIPCMTDCNPLCDIKWYYNGTISSDSLIPTVDGELVLLNVSRSQQDVYYCEVSHAFIPGARLNQSITLEVLYGPEDLELSPNMVEPQPEGATLLPVTCSVNCNPDCPVTWYFESVNPGSIVPTTGGVLQIVNINRNDAGLYICQVKNTEITNSTQQIEIYIPVYCLPSEIEMSVDPDQDEYEVDDEVTLKCSGEFTYPVKPWNWQYSVDNSDEWTDITNFTVSPEIGDGCSYSQETSVSITAREEVNGWEVRCIQNNIDQLSKSKVITVKEDDQNGDNGGNTVTSFPVMIIISVIWAVLVYH